MSRRVVLNELVEYTAYVFFSPARRPFNANSSCRGATKFVDRINGNGAVMPACREQTSDDHLLDFYTKRSLRAGRVENLKVITPSRRTDFIRMDVSRPVGRTVGKGGSLLPALLRLLTSMINFGDGCACRGKRISTTSRSCIDILAAPAGFCYDSTLKISTKGLPVIQFCKLVGAAVEAVRGRPALARAATAATTGPVGEETWPLLGTPYRVLRSVAPN